MKEETIAINSSRTFLCNANDLLQRKLKRDLLHQKSRQIYQNSKLREYGCLLR